MSPIDPKLIESVLRSAIEGGKVVVGAKEVVDSARSSRLVVFAANGPPKILERVQVACKSASVPTVAFEGSSLDLGRICRKPYRIVAVGIRSPGTVDIAPLLVAPEGRKA